MGAWESAKRLLVLPHGGSVRMFGIAATSGRYERRTVRRLSTWSREYLREAAIADLGCAVLGVFTRFAAGKRLHQQRAGGRRLLSAAAVGHEANVADLVQELGRDPYDGPTGFRR